MTPFHRGEQVSTHSLYSIRHTNCSTYMHVNGVQYGELHGNWCFLMFCLTLILSLSDHLKIFIAD